MLARFAVNRIGLVNYSSVSALAVGGGVPLLYTNVWARTNSQLLSDALHLSRTNGKQSAIAFSEHVTELRAAESVSVRLRRNGTKVDCSAKVVSDRNSINHE